MRIRFPFAAAFFVLCLLAAYLGLSSVHIPANDKFLHFVTFFILTLCFYWILEASRRRVVNITLGTCTLVLGIGSEFLQQVATSRSFDAFDILANLAGSGFALLLCSWYHRRMLERRRLGKISGSYQNIPTDENEAGEVAVEFDQGDGESGTELQEIEAQNTPGM